ncbi:MAG: hypothetical protein JNL93_18705 [Pelomonas sp.]|nr:hypothetical protein [Roseateles sp.]
MTLDAHLPQVPALESGALPPLWATLTPAWAALTPPSAVEAELGYESALPFTLVEPLGALGSPSRY